MSLGVLLYVSSSAIGNLQEVVDNRWFVYQYLLMASYMLVLLALRKEAIRLFTVYGYRIMMYSLTNFYIDTYTGIKDWSWNDRLTIGLILIEALIVIIKNKK